MTENSNKIIQNFKKIKTYWILSEENDAFIVGTTLLFSESYTNTNNTFQVVKMEKNRVFPIYFLFTMASKAGKLENFFEKHKLPVVIADNFKTIKTPELLEKFLDEYLIKTYKSYD